jgi:hypothetical protein
VGVTSTVTITAAHAADAINNTFKVAAKVATAPSTSKTKTDTNTASLGVTIVTGSGTGESLSQANAYVAGGANAVVGSTEDAATSSTFKVSFRADVEGTYTVLVSAGNTSYTAGDKTVVVTFTTVGAPTAVTVASIGGSVVTGGTTNGQLFGMTLKDANGNATVLGLDESIVISESDAAVAIKDFAGNALTAFGAGTDAAGTYLFRAVESSAGGVATGSTVITLTGSGLLPSSLVTNTTATKVTAGAWSAHTGVDAVADVACKAASTVCVAGSNFSVNGAATVTVSGFVSTGVAAATKYIVKVSTAAAVPMTYDSTITLAATATGGTAVVTADFTAPAPTASYDSVIELGNTPFTVTFKYGKPVAKAIATTNTTSVLSALAGTSTFVAKVTDQYGNAVLNEAVTIKVSGRNTVAEKALALTDANGLVSYTHTDAGTTGTVDTVTFGAAGASTTKSAAYTINYGTVTVGTVTVEGGSTEADDGLTAGTTKTTIKAGDNGPEGSAVDITATVKDANGNLLAGVPVTFTVSAGAIVKTASVDYATVYTNASGEATSKVFGWITGTQTITATAGGKTGTDYLTWAANDATTARVLTATATGDILSLKVVDRFGNAVQGVAINLSRTGAGLFGNGASTQDISTDKNGTADVRFLGSGTVVAELAATYAQAYAAAGNITTKAATAATAGTTKGTGNTLTPAGVAKVSVVIAEGSDPVAVSSQAAADAAAEATDAANAATDAANAAAEAADAATAAAQDAADAVAALSTQVSEMVNALKKQITALTNLVIKIQKKVRA